MGDRKHRVCPVSKAGGLDNRIRRWVQNPRKIVGPYVKEGMTVLDVGCGPGFFSMDIAYMVGESGRVIACDLQDGMLQKLGKKLVGTPIQDRITLHKCEKDRLGLSESVDFVLAFYVVHEIPNQQDFFREIKTILKPGGKMLIVEPPFHASHREFDETVRRARETGFTVVEKPAILLNKAVVLGVAHEPGEEAL